LKLFEIYLNIGVTRCTIMQLCNRLLWWPGRWR